MSQYMPTINEGFYPLDAGWTEDQDESILILCVPELQDIVQEKIESYDYTWLFESSIDAYIFCFRLENKEFALVFQFKHAGKLLLEPDAYETFSMAITSTNFQSMTENTPYLLLPHISLNRQPVAGW
ncbi:hypothetical protein ACOI1C_08865 [Bacillus sp. DJP31]|uniref:hypothetical protein n=1 Tax=Bacillus sp. DJP31 TaxID=3409789 RepID=UPI003BB69F9D